MGISFHNGVGHPGYHHSDESLHFDDQSQAALERQLSKDEIVQTRIKIALIVIALILFAAGCTTLGLAFAVVIPYGLFHTWMVVAGTGLAALALMGGSFLYLDADNHFTASLTNRPAYPAIKRKIFSVSTRTVLCKKEWTYLTKFHQERRKEMRKILDEQFLRDSPKDITTHQPIHTFMPLVDLIESYL